MRLLLDTHAFLWWLAGDELLSAAGRAAIGNEDNAVYVSAATMWEIATKHRIGKLPMVGPIIGDLQRSVDDQGFTGLPITLLHGQVAGQLAGPHKDPFDRMLIAQALLEQLTIVSNEQPFDVYGVPGLW